MLPGDTSSGHLMKVFVKILTVGYCDAIYKCMHLIFFSAGDFTCKCTSLSLLGKLKTDQAVNYFVLYLCRFLITW
jgi:hypothetical protein